MSKIAFLGIFIFLRRHIVPSGTIWIIQTVPHGTIHFKGEIISQVRETIIFEAMKLILLKGVKASSLNEILKNAHAGKGQFYHYFESKEDLIAQIIRYYGCEVLESHMQSLTKVENLQEFIAWVRSSFPVTQLKDQVVGCLLGTIANEIVHTQNNLKDEITKVFDHWRGLLTSKIAELVNKQFLISETPAEELADFLLMVFEGSSLLSKLHQDETKTKMAFDHYCLHLQLYVSPKYRI